MWNAFPNSTFIGLPERRWPLKNSLAVGVALQEFVDFSRFFF
jgi:hypothetical protein